MHSTSTRLAHRRTSFLGALFAVALLGVAGCSDDGGSGSSPFDVSAPGGSTLESDGGQPTFDFDLPDPTFTALPGRIRFANFVSDGTGGVDLDIYWGQDPEIGQLMGTVPYGTVTEFMSPMRQDPSMLDADEASWSVVPAGGTTREEMIGSGDEPFTAETTLTIAMSGVEPLPSQPALNLSKQVFYEHELSVPPAGFAHVYAWDSPWAAYIEGGFGVVGSAATCYFDDGVGTGGNVGTPALVPAGTSGLELVDANTECATGSGPVTGSVEAGRSYVLIGLAPTTDPAERTAVLLPLGD